MTKYDDKKVAVPSDTGKPVEPQKCPSCPTPAVDPNPPTDGWTGVTEICRDTTVALLAEAGVFVTEPRIIGTICQYPGCGADRAPHDSRCTAHTFSLM